jgi:hypothetical protein
MHRFIIFIMGGVIIALGFAVVSLSTVALMAQTMALLSQCVLVLGMIGVGVIIVGGIALRNRVIQVYLARQLLGAEGDRLLLESGDDRGVTWPVMFPRQQTCLPLTRTTAQAPQPTPLRTMPTLPVMPQGWGFDEED